MTDRQQENGRRYYLVEQAIGIDHGIDAWIFVNEREALPPRWPEIYHREEWGSRTIPGVTEGSVRYIGLPRLRATPRFILGKGKKATIDAYEISGDLTIVSDRLKRLLEAVDPSAFEFAPVEATHGPTGAPELGPYWAYAVIRVLNCVDEARSDIKYFDYTNDPDTMIRNPRPHYRRLNMAKMISEVVGNAAAFVLERDETAVIFDDRIVDAYRADKMKGFRFSPLQEPVSRERKGSWAIYISNRKYWHDRGVI